MKEYDFSGYVCPISKVKAIEVINNLEEGEGAKMIFGDMDSVKSVAQELKTKSIVPRFAQEGDSKFILTITR